jgi:putative SOS response-associated peptidase YedK
MCGRFLIKTTWQELYKEYEIDKDILLPQGEMICAPRAKILVIRKDSTQEKRIIEYFIWGATIKQAYGVTFNIRSESIGISPTWKDAFLKNRCLIPATAFIEWQKVEGKTKKDAWKIFQSNQVLYSLAGIYMPFKNLKTNEMEICAFVLTTSANEKMQTIHNSGNNQHRQPVIIKKENYDSWLDPKNQDLAKIHSLLHKFEESEFEYDLLEQVTHEIVVKNKKLKIQKISEQLNLFGNN